MFEYLGTIRLLKSFYGARRLRFKFHSWRKMGIQNKVEEMAHYLGIKV